MLPIWNGRNAHVDGREAFLFGSQSDGLSLKSCGNDRVKHLALANFLLMKKLWGCSGYDAECFMSCAEVFWMCVVGCVSC